jgi:hypothetical protein
MNALTKGETCRLLDLEDSLFDDSVERVNTLPRRVLRRLDDMARRTG